MAASLQRPRGFLRIYLGAAAGVGKTYQMLGDARLAAEEGTDIVIGYLEPHGRVATEERARGLERAPVVRYGSGSRAETEPDVDWLIERRPSVAIVDELAHTNPPGAPRPKRYDDVDTLLAHGIDVWTTVNIQHLESLGSRIRSLTGVEVRETFPDRLLHEADEIKLVDLSPASLRERIARGLVYGPDRVEQALNGFFTVSNLTALRALVLHELAEVAAAQLDTSAPGLRPSERVLVATGGRRDSYAQLIRAGARLARRSDSELYVLAVEPQNGRTDADTARVLSDAEALTRSLGGVYLRRRAENPAAEIIREAEAQHITQIVIGKSRRSGLRVRLGGSLVEAVLRGTSGIDVHVVDDRARHGPRRRRMSAPGGSVKRTLVGRRMPMGSLEDELLPRWIALPIFASDPLSSVAYATEAALVVLVATSVASRGLIVPISAVIAALLLVVVLSYRQTIFAYPNGGGSYVVAKENLGQMAGLVAAASLLVDYVLTAAVSIASGVLAVTSAVPELSTHAVELSLGVLVVLVVVNLRGVRESGFVFALPTYGFIIAIGAMIAVGFVRGLLYGWPTAHVPDPAPVGLATGVGIVVLLRAFASGCSALTGVEAISNGVTAFRRPQARNAASTLMSMGVIAIILFLGVSILAWKVDALPSESVSVLSEIARAVFPPGASSFGYYAVQATTAAVLALAANTAFQGFPRLAALLASDSFLPRQFSNLGDRLVYSNGILVLALAAGALIVGFHADVNSLIHLYLLGVFTAFTLSQFGMVKHHWRRRDSGRSRASLSYKIGLNATGGLLTGLVGAIVITTKFGEGAWMVVIAIPVLVLCFAVVGRHYADVRTRLRDPGGDYAVVRGPVVLFVSALDDATAEALRYVRAIAGDGFQAIHVADAGGVTGIAQAWRGFSGGDGPPLLALPRERTVSGTVARYVRETERAPGEVTTLVVPELFKRRSLVAILRGRTTLALRLRLQGEEDVVLADVPVVADARGLRHPPSGQPKTVVLMPISELNAASRHALGYALGLGSEHVVGLHVELGSDDVSQTRAAWAARALPIPIKVVPSPYRDLGQPLLSEIRAITADPDAVCVVVMPEIISPHGWQRLLHNQRALFIKRLLLFEERVVLTSVPYRLPQPGEAPPRRRRRGPSGGAARGRRSRRARPSARPPCSSSAPRVTPRGPRPG